MTGRLGSLRRMLKLSVERINELLEGDRIYQRLQERTSEALSGKGAATRFSEKPIP